MKCAEEYMRLYAVTDRAWVGGQTLYQQVESALKGGVTCVQLREKELDEEAFLKEAFELHDLCKKYNVPFFINDNVDIAIRCHAEGIHVGQEDMAAAQVRQRVGDEMMIGVSVHSVEEALEAVRHGADCLGVGAAFSTHTKADVDVLPEGMMKAICDAVDIPVVAIGGIHKENLLRLKGTGVNGVALVSAIFGAEDIEAECRELKALGSKKVAVLTPYPEATNEAEKKFLEDNGFEVTNIVGMDVSYIRCEGRKMEACDEYFLYRNAMKMDLKGADTFFLSCMGLTTMEIVDELETLLGVPVLTSHQATLWSALRHCRVGAKLPKLGKLFTL